MVSRRKVLVEGGKALGFGLLTGQAAMVEAQFLGIGRKKKPAKPAVPAAATSADAEAAYQPTMPNLFEQGKADWPPEISPLQEALLDEIERTAYLYFWEQAHPKTGQVLDRALADGSGTFGSRRFASIAATGFGLTALCIADKRGYRDAGELKERVRRTLKFLLNNIGTEHGFYYHFLDWETGKPWPRSEVSTIDTAILLCGVLTARQHYADDRDIAETARQIYERVDWPWFLNGGKTLSMGWFVEQKFILSRWAVYSELMMMYLLAIGSPTHPLPPESWQAFDRPFLVYDGIRYYTGEAPLFTHQYSHAWFDFRQKRDMYTDYFQNSINATKAHKLFCLSLDKQYPDYTDDCWGVSASDSAHGYTAWGGPPLMGRIDGSLVPNAAAGSLPFLPQECLRVLLTLRQKYGNVAWRKYGFVDAFNPLTGWADTDALGIDQGISMLMAENLRSGFVWDTFMKNPEARMGMEKAGFKPVKAVYS